VDNSWP